MNTTRRDILKALSLTSLTVALPIPVIAHEPRVHRLVVNPAGPGVVAVYQTAEAVELLRSGRAMASLMEPERRFYLPPDGKGFWYTSVYNLGWHHKRDAHPGLLSVLATWWPADREWIHCAAPMG